MSYCRKLIAIYKSIRSNKSKTLLVDGTLISIYMT